MVFHFNVNLHDFLPAIAGQQNVTNKKGTLAILMNVLLDVQQGQLTLTGTDLEIGLKQSIPAEVFESGTLTLPAKKLFELSRETSSSIISFKEVANDWVEITVGSSLYRLAGMAADDFPEFPEYDQAALVPIKASSLGELIDKTLFSISTDRESMYSLTGALLQKETVGEQRTLKMISSDGHRLSIMSRDADETIDNLTLNPITLIPRKGLQEMRKFCDDYENLLLGVEKKQAVLKSDDSLLIIRLIEGEFPDYKGILNIISRDNLIYIDRLALLESLKRINLFTENIFHAIKVEIADNKLIMHSQHADFGSAMDEIDVEYSGPPLTLGFNCKYFIDILQVMEGKTICAAISSDNSPCLITSDDDPGFISVIMPMQI